MYDHVGKTYQEQLKDQWSTCNPVDRQVGPTSLVEYRKLMGRGIPSSGVLKKKHIAIKKNMIPLPK